MLTLLIYVDGSAASQQAVSYIAPLASETDVTVTVLTAQQNPERADALFRRTAEQLKSASLQHVNRSDAADVALLAEATAGRYDLAVFAPLAEHWSRWIRLGTKPALSAQLPISSLLVQGSSATISHVLLCAGGDETIIEDAALTVRLARRVAASATILHVLSQVPLLFGTRDPGERLLEAFAATGAPEVTNMNQAVEVLRAGGVDAAIKLRVGLVIEEIQAELQEGGYDLLVVGAHRSQGLVERLLLENVTANILGHSPVPVLVIKTFNKT